jgi:hypothetical protein
VIRETHLALNTEAISHVIESVMSHKSWRVLVETTANNFQSGVGLDKLDEVLQVFLGDNLWVNEEKLQEDTIFGCFLCVEVAVICEKLSNRFGRPTLDVSLFEHKVDGLRELIILFGVFFVRCVSLWIEVVDSA